MKILFVVNVDWFFFSHRLPIALAALKTGYQVHVATTFTDNKYAVRLTSLGIIIHPLNFDRSGRNILSFFSNFYSLYNLFRLLDPDILHLVTIQPVLLGGLAARFAGIQRIVFAISGLGHMFHTYSSFSRLRSSLVRFFYKMSIKSEYRAVVFQNPDDCLLLSKVCSLNEDESYVINGSGVDTSLFAYTSLPNESIVLMACRLLETKGVADFVEAAEILKKRGVSARFLLAGSPDFSNPASISLSQLSTWSDQGYVEILGHCSNMHSLISNSQVFCLPSYYPEGLPKVLCEAASSGRAVVTADEPGCRDAIENGLTGILVKSRDPVMLANVLEDLLHNKEILLSMGLAARKRAEELFDINVIVHQHLFIYSRLLNRAAP